MVDLDIVEPLAKEFIEKLAVGDLEWIMESPDEVISMFQKMAQEVLDRDYGN